MAGHEFEQLAALLAEYRIGRRTFIRRATAHGSERVPDRDRPGDPGRQRKKRGGDGAASRRVPSRKCRRFQRSPFGTPACRRSTIPTS